MRRISSSSSSSLGDIPNFVRSLFLALHRIFESYFIFLLLYSYESIIATLCESLDTLDEPEAKVLVFLPLLLCRFTA